MSVPTGVTSEIFPFSIESIWVYLPTETTYSSDFLAMKRVYLLIKDVMTVIWTFLGQDADFRLFVEENQKKSEDLNWKLEETVNT